MTVSFWVILLAVLAYGGLHSWLASLELKAWATQRWGKRVERVYRLLYNLMAGITLLPVLMLPVALMDRPIYKIPPPWMYITFTIQGLAILLLIGGVLQTGVMVFLGVCQLVRCVDERESTLVVTGLYRWVRHPLYTAGLVFVWLMPWMSWNLLALDLGLTIYIIVGAMLEERKLLVEFGPDYEEYRQKTPMLVPGFKLKLH